MIIENFRHKKTIPQTSIVSNIHTRRSKLEFNLHNTVFSSYFDSDSICTSLNSNSGETPEKDLTN